MPRALIIPAAGLGSRLRSDTPKALTMVNGRPMLAHLVDLFRPFVHLVVVIAHPAFADAVRKWLSGKHTDVSVFRVAEQASPTGMLDAILLGDPHVRAAGPDRVWIVWCDQVALLRDTLERLADAERSPQAPDLIFPTTIRHDPYIHFSRSADGTIAGVLQRREGDAMPAQGESDIGLFSLSARAWNDLTTFGGTARIGRGTGERNFLPFIPWLAGRAPVGTIPCADPREAIGINTPDELATIEAWLRERPSEP